MNLTRSTVPKPVYALADSRLLYWRKEDGWLFVKEMIETSESAHPRIAYIGASNADRLECYHEIFEPAMRNISSCEYRMVFTRPLPQDGEFLESAEAIVLAGGSVEVGWRAFAQNGFQELILRRFHEGATLIGVSAGAVQLGQGGPTDDGTMLLKTFGILPFYVGVHEERQQWEWLRKTLAMVPGAARGIGIPSGAGLIYHAGEVQPVCDSVHEITIEGDQVLEDWLRCRGSF